MFIDAHTVADSTVLTTDVCIVGAGAAGITLARELGDGKRDVLLVESGGLEFEAATQALYSGRNIGRDYFPLDAARLRFFGGTTNHWTGWCKPLNPSDFEKRLGTFKWLAD